MARYDPVLIERHGGRYELTQGGRVLLAVPQGIFEKYHADTVFPPQWKADEGSHPVRRLFWNPETAEFLMVGLEVHPARATESFGATPYRSFLQGFWVPSPPLLLFRPYWNPVDPYEPFDKEARRRSFETQVRCLEIFANLRPPTAWTAILNATDPYLEALGLDPRGSPPEPDVIREVSLVPPGRMEDPAVKGLLEMVAIDHAGTLFPVLRQKVLASFHGLCLSAIHAAQALLDRWEIDHQEGSYRLH